MFLLSQMTDESSELMDWSFLNEPDGIETFVNDLFAFNVLLFKNEEEDTKVFRLLDPVQVPELILSNFNKPSETKQLILSNNTGDPLCPYFRIIMEDYSPKHVTNYKLETFFRRTGILGTHCRCSKAMIIGLMSNTVGSSMVDVPVEYYISPQRYVDVSTPIELSSTKSVLRTFKPDTVMGIEGMCLPVTLPVELHWSILKFLRHPCAVIISDYKQHLLLWMTYWDDHFDSIVTRYPSWQHRI